MRNDYFDSVKDFAKVLEIVGVVSAFVSLLMINIENTLGYLGISVVTLFTSLKLTQTINKK